MHSPDTQRPSPARRAGPIIALLALCWPALAIAQAPAADPEAAESPEADRSSGIIPYIEYNGGVSIVRDQNLKGADAPGAFIDGKTEQNTGWTLGGAFGARFLEHFRGELHLNFRSAEVRRLSIQGEDPNANGDVEIFTAMANVFADYDFGVGVIPYVGVGIGYGLFWLDSDNALDQVQIDEKDSLFVWNVMAGATVPLTDIVDLSLGYRYFEADDPRLEARIAGVGNRRVEYEYDAHEVVAGLRFNF